MRQMACSLLQSKKQDQIRLRIRQLDRKTVRGLVDEAEAVWWNIMLKVCKA